LVRARGDASDQAEVPLEFTAAIRKSYVLSAHSPATRSEHMGGSSFATATAAASSPETLASLSDPSDLLESSTCGKRVG
jgi:hypothetical protein